MAVKIFNTVEECSWRREKEIYDLVGHPQVLGYRGADVVSLGSTTMLL